VTVTVDDWDRVLDAFAGRLAAQRAALTAGRPGEVADFEPPAGVGPLPGRLQERARQLVAEAEAVAAALEAAVARVGRELAALERTAEGEPPSIPSFIDQRA
jgi:hypothetical protein